MNVPSYQTISLSYVQDAGNQFCCPLTSIVWIKTLVFFSYIPLTKECYTVLEWHEGEQMITEFSFCVNYLFKSEFLNVIIRVELI